MEENDLTVKVREFLKAFLFMNEISVEAKKSKDNKFIRVYIYPCLLYTSDAADE